MNLAKFLVSVAIELTADSSSNENSGSSNSTIFWDEHTTYGVPFIGGKSVGADFINNDNIKPPTTNNNLL